MEQYFIVSKAIQLTAKLENQQMAERSFLYIFIIIFSGYWIFTNQIWCVVSKKKGGI